MDNTVNQSEFEEKQRIIYNSQLENNPAQITVERGRLIKLMKKTIKGLENKTNKTEEEIATLNKYKEALKEELYKHKIQLKDRYSKEFIHGKAKVGDIFTTLPKGIATQCKRIVNTINEIKNAKNNKEKLKAALGTMKESATLLATPAIFAGKFACEHWYLVLALLKILPSIQNLLNGLDSKILGLLTKLFPFLNGNKKDKDDDDKDKDKGDGKEEMENETVPETANEPVLESVPIPKALPKAVNESLPSYVMDEAGAPQLSPAVEPASTPAIESSPIPKTLPKAVNESLPSYVMDEAGAPQLSPAVEPSAQPIAVPNTPVVQHTEPYFNGKSMVYPGTNQVFNQYGFDITNKDNRQDLTGDPAAMAAAALGLGALGLLAKGGGGFPALAMKDLYGSPLSTYGNR